VERARERERESEMEGTNGRRRMEGDRDIESL
jgi:hypothetical protein